MYIRILIFRIRMIGKRFRHVVCPSLYLLINSVFMETNIFKIWPNRMSYINLMEYMEFLCRKSDGKSMMSCIADI